MILYRFAAGAVWGDGLAGRIAPGIMRAASTSRNAAGTRGRRGREGVGKGARSAIRRPAQGRLPDVDRLRSRGRAGRRSPAAPCARSC